MGHALRGFAERLRTFSSDSATAPVIAPPSAGGQLPVVGCYLLQYTPIGSSGIFLDGTLRVEASTGQLRASGDLYERQLSESGDLIPAPDPAAGIPILPIDAYRFYLRVTEIAETTDGFSLAFEAYRFTALSVTLFNGDNTRWPCDGAFKALLNAAPDATGFPAPERCYVGDVQDNAGTTVGQLSMGWVSSYLRKATIEIDREPDSELPLTNGAGVTWRTIFDKIGWDLTVLVSDSDLAALAGRPWTNINAQAVMHARRDKSDLDAEWRYHILAIGLIEYQGGERGVMYDDAGGFPNRLPREGLMVSSHYEFPNEDLWGLVKGARAGTTVTYFRTAVHEFGHALGLEHNTAGSYFMATTPLVAGNAGSSPATLFPMNIEWSFSPEDEHRLRHWPDLIVRPGGLNNRTGRTAPIEGPAMAQRLQSQAESAAPATAGLECDPC